jgi:hypothetical protein
MVGLCFNVICKCTKDLTSFYLNFAPYRHEHTLQDQIGKMFSQDWQLLIMKSVLVSHAPPGRGYPLIDLHGDVKRFGVKSTYTKCNEFFGPLLITISSCRCVLLWANGIGKGIRIVIENVLTKINNQI